MTRAQRIAIADQDGRIAAANKLIAELTASHAALFGALKLMLDEHGGMCVSAASKAAVAPIEQATGGIYVREIKCTGREHLAGDVA
ncbi:MAG: hypothetical protein WBR29_07435 [Gammaproteobacteria bacterium]